MHSNKGKSRRISSIARADLRSAPVVSRKRMQPVSAARLADELCQDMIQNLRHNVAEDKKRLQC
jgi:hypothetical protein